jgi:hypothetical protein
VLATDAERDDEGDEDGQERDDDGDRGDDDDADAGARSAWRVYAPVR